MSGTDVTPGFIPGSAEEILERMEDGFMRLDAAWRITCVNAAAEKADDVTREALLGRVFWDAFPAVPGTVVERELRRAMSDRVPVRGEHLYEPYGRWFETDIHPLGDGGLAFFGRDVTDRRVAEEERRRLYGLVARKAAELARSEALLAEAQQLAHVGSWNWDLTTHEIIWSDEHYRIVGLRPQEVPMTRDRAAGYIHPDDRPAAWEAVNRSLKDRRPYEWTLRIVREDGAVRVAQSRGQPVYDGNGHPVRLFGTMQDVTERKREDEIRAVLAAIVESSDDAIIGKTLGGTISSCNDGARRIFGYDAEEVIGRPVTVLIPAELVEEESNIQTRLGREEAEPG